MAWTTPKTFVNGAVLTASDMNTYVSANTLEVFERSEGIGPNVVQTVKSDTFSASVAAGAFSGAAVSATITPSSETSKILVVVNLSLTGTSADQVFAIFRGGVALDAATGNAEGSRKRVTSGMTFTERTAGSTSAMFLDSPATTSATTYDVRLGHSASTTQTVYLNRGNTDDNSNRNNRSISTVTLIEVNA